MARRPTIDQVIGMGDVVDMIHWGVDFIEFPAIPGIPSSEALNLRCISTGIPRLVPSFIEVSVRGLMVNQPAISRPAGSIALTFYETVDNVISKFLYDWQQLCFNRKTGANGESRECKAIVRLTRLNKQNEPIWEYILYGCLIDAPSHGETLGGEATAMQPTFSLRYDYFEERPLI